MLSPCCTTSCHVSIAVMTCHDCPPTVNSGLRLTGSSYQYCMYTGSCTLSGPMAAARCGCVVETGSGSLPSLAQDRQLLSGRNTPRASARNVAPGDGRSSHPLSVWGTLLSVQPYFTGQSRAMIIVNVNPSEIDYKETFNTLRFSALSRDITTRARRTLLPQVPQDLRARTLAADAAAAVRARGA